MEEEKPSEEKKDFSEQKLAPSGERLVSPEEKSEEAEKISLAERAGKKETLLEPGPTMPKSDLSRSEAVYSSILEFITPIFDKVKNGKESEIKSEEILGWVQEFTDRLRESISPGDMIRLVFRHDEYEDCVK